MVKGAAYGNAGRRDVFRIFLGHEKKKPAPQLGGESRKGEHSLNGGRIRIASIGLRRAVQDEVLDVDLEIGDVVLVDFDVPVGCGRDFASANWRRGSEFWPTTFATRTFACARLSGENQIHRRNR